MAVGKNAGSQSQKANDFLEPLAPVSVVATNVGTNRGFDNGAASVSFSLPANSPAATSFTVYSSPGNLSATGASSPVVVEGLSSATAYTFTVIATNADGSSSLSAASAAITVSTVPAQIASVTVSTPAPSAPANVAGASQDVVTWSAPLNGGLSITSYNWTSSDGKSGSTAGTSVTVNQEGGTAQTYTVSAVNANGASVGRTSSSITTFGFTPFSFTPFGAFGFTPFNAFGFTPFNAFSFTPFGAFSFTPFNFVPFKAFSFTPFNFVPFKAFSFTPRVRIV